MDRTSIVKLLFSLAGIAFVVAAMLSKNKAFIPIGMCFVIISIVWSRKDRKN